MSVLIKAGINTTLYKFRFSQVQTLCHHKHPKSTMRLFNRLVRDGIVREGEHFVYHEQSYQNGRKGSKQNTKLLPRFTASGMRLMVTASNNKEGIRSQDNQLVNTLTPLLQEAHTQKEQITVMKQALMQYMTEQTRAIENKLSTTTNEVKLLLEEQRQSFTRDRQDLQDKMNRITALLDAQNEDEGVRGKLMAMDIGEKFLTFHQAKRDCHELVKTLWGGILAPIRWSKANKAVNEAQFSGEGVLPAFGMISLSYLKYRDKNNEELDKIIEDMLSYRQRLLLIRDERAVELL